MQNGNCVAGGSYEIKPRLQEWKRSMLVQSGSQIAFLDRIGLGDRPKRATALPAGMVYGVDDRPPLPLTLFAGLQCVGLINVYLVYLLVLTSEAGVPPATVAAMVGLSMLTLGVAALLQALPRGPVGSGYFCPAVLSANYLGPSLWAIQLGGLPLVCAMTVFAGLLQAMLSPFVSRLKPLFSTEISGLVVSLVGLSVGLIGVRYTFDVGATVSITHLAVALVTFGTTVFLTVWGKGAWRMLGTLIGMTVGYAASIVTGLLTWADLHAFASLPLFAMPRLGHIDFAFSPALITPFAVGALASTAKTMGVISSCQKLNDAGWREPDMESLRRGVLADGLGTVFAGLCGTLGINSTPSAVAIPAATGMASRRIAYVIAAAFAVLTFLPLISVALAVMPKAVIGGLTLFSGCFVFVNGLQMIASSALDQRRTLVVGLGMIGGVAVEVFPSLAAGLPAWAQPLLSSSLVLGTLIAMVANLLLFGPELWSRKDKTVGRALGEDNPDFSWIEV
jgi:xanthine permease XanP